MSSLHDLLKGYWLLLSGITPLPRRGRLAVRGAARAFDDPATQTTVLEIPGGGLADAIGSGATSGASSAQILAFTVPENGRARVQLDVYAYTGAYSDPAERLITCEHWTVERDGAGTVAVSGQDVISTDGTLAPTIAVNGVGSQFVVTATGVGGEDIAYAARLRVLVGPSGLTGESAGGLTMPAPIVISGGSSGPLWTTEAVPRTASFAAQPGYHYEVDSSGGDITITLPTTAAALAATNPDVRITFAGAGSNVDLDPNGELIRFTSAEPSSLGPKTIAGGGNGESITLSPTQGTWNLVSFVQ